jgi:hypothetical protein
MARRLFRKQGREMVMRTAAIAFVATLAATAAHAQCYDQSKSPSIFPCDKLQLAPSTNGYPVPVNPGAGWSHAESLLSLDKQTPDALEQAYNACQEVLPSGARSVEQVLVTDCKRIMELYDKRKLDADRQVIELALKQK